MKMATKNLNHQKYEMHVGLYIQINYFNYFKIFFYLK